MTRWSPDAAARSTWSIARPKVSISLPPDFMCPSKIRWASWCGSPGTIGWGGDPTRELPGLVLVCVLAFLEHGITFGGQAGGDVGGLLGTQALRGLLGPDAALDLVESAALRSIALSSRRLTRTK
jgi:hypothetical protein